MRRRTRKPFAPHYAKPSRIGRSKNPWTRCSEKVASGQSTGEVPPGYQRISWGPSVGRGPSPVSNELLVNAQDRRPRSLVREYTRPMERTGRVVSPTFDDWIEAAEIVTAIEEKDRGWSSKLPALLNDILIALCARRVGAMLLTYNRDDFRLIHRHKDFSLRILQK